MYHYSVFNTLEEIIEKEDLLSHRRYSTNSAISNSTSEVGWHGTATVGRMSTAIGGDSHIDSPTLGKGEIVEAPSTPSATTRDRSNSEHLGIRHGVMTLEELELKMKETLQDIQKQVY